MTIFRTIALLSLLSSLSPANSHTHENNESSYIDDTHAQLSETIMDWSETIDRTIGKWLGHTDNNCSYCTTKSLDITDTSLKNKIHKVDTFFQSDKYFNETENTFIRVRLGSTFETKGPNDFNLRLSAQIPFSRSKNHLKIFVNDMTEDNVGNILQDDSNNKVSSPQIGVHYFSPEKYGIFSRYSLGIRGIDPFVGARFNMHTQVNNWSIDPVQILKYSTDDKFEEETNIYFDREFDELSLFRLQLHRKTQEDVSGMDYALSLMYYWSPKDDRGLSFSQTFFGNTEYKYRVDSSTPMLEYKTYSGIHDYATSFSWRENIWRKWFYYEVRPSVNFHKQYDYAANYSIHILFDFYFGRYN